MTITLVISEASAVACDSNTSRPPCGTHVAGSGLASPGPESRR